MGNYAGSSVSEQFRARAGLPKRTSDKPVSDKVATDPNEIEHTTGPKGGFGGNADNTNAPAVVTQEDADKAAKKTAAKKSAPAKKTAAKKTAAKKMTAKKGGK